MINITTIKNSILPLKKYIILLLLMPDDTKELRAFNKVKALEYTTNNNTICKGIFNSLSKFITLLPLKDTIWQYYTSIYCEYQYLHRSALNNKRLSHNDMPLETSSNCNCFYHNRFIVTKAF